MHNKDVIEAVDYLKHGRVILCPTDTIWGLSCNALDEHAIKKIIEIKHRPDNKSFIILVSSFDMLKFFIKNIPLIAYKLDQESDRPITLIYPDPINLPDILVNDENTIAVRLVRNDFCKDVINLLGAPIVSTSANISGSAAPIDFESIDIEIKNAVDYIVPIKYENIVSHQASRIVKIINENEYTIIRE
jgi:L-threonylcarbamoyladenylate synthase